MTTDRPLVAAVDDDLAILEVWKRILGKACDVHPFSSPTAALAAFATTEFDVVLLDLNMPEMDGLTVLSRLRALQPHTEALVVTGTGTVETAVQALKMGAFDFLAKPLESIDVAAARVQSAYERRRLRRLNASLAAKLAAFDPGTLVGECLEMRRVREHIARIGASDAPVLVCGESGTGKELAARALLAASRRAERPFVTLNCAAISETLIDSELFGHERGAFTGAVAAHRGLFEAADGGTLFLDEIGELPAQTQAKLLRVLQEGEVRPVGSTKSKKVDVRVIAATNVDLEKAIKADEFREDLFYRINTFRITLPPLRDRTSDIPLLAQHLLSRCSKRIGKAVTGFTDEALEVMLSYGWPGNVRQLQNAVEYGATLCATEKVEVTDLPPFVAVRRGMGRTPVPPADGVPPGELTATPYGVARANLLHDFDVRYLTETMTAANGSISGAARRSGIDRANLRRMLTRHDLDHLRRSQ